MKMLKFFVACSIAFGVTPTISAQNAGDTIAPIHVSKTPKPVGQKPVQKFIDPGISEIPAEKWTPYEQAVVQEAKGLLPSDETELVYQSVKKTLLGLWITLTYSEKAGSYLNRYEILKQENKKPVLFYKHNRVIDIITSHLGRLLLINDFPASKASDILILDLKTMKKWDIGHEAAERYCKEINTKDYMTEPHPIAFSPDDQEVLMQMKVEWSMYANPKKNEEFERTYSNWSYVVSAKTGKIQREIRNKTIPENWWIDEKN
jgi:hypothetical protein